MEISSYICKSIEEENVSNTKEKEITDLEFTLETNTDSVLETNTNVTLPYSDLNEEKNEVAQTLPQNEEMSLSKYNIKGFKKDGTICDVEESTYITDLQNELNPHNYVELNIRNKIKNAFSLSLNIPQDTISRSSSSRNSIVFVNSNINFEQINKYNVAIRSLKNALKIAASFEEVIIILGKINELERSIINEKMQDNNELNQKKKNIECKIDKVRRKLKLYEDELEYVANAIENRTEGYRNKLEQKINSMRQFT